MKQRLLQERYPLFSLEIDRHETRFTSAREIAAYLRGRIEAHPAARFIAEFDHLAHTKGLEQGQVSDDILAAINLVFCFGFTLPDPRVLAVRPRSLGVAETRTGFIISFMEAPMPVANMLMEEWARSVRTAGSESE